MDISLAKIIRYNSADDIKTIVMNLVGFLALAWTALYLIQKFGTHKPKEPS